MANIEVDNTIIADTFSKSNLHDNDCIDVNGDLQKINNWGYKTAKGRMVIELRDMITAILIVFARSDSVKIFKNIKGRSFFRP